ncbi:MAG: hypothetical protein V3R99_03830 [Thermoguttaceae bacterium]
MSIQEITGVVINSNRMTNDLPRIEAALFSGEPVEYVSREQATSMAHSTHHAEWEAFARAPALFVIIDGVRYRRSQSDGSINVPMPTTHMVPVSLVAG